MKKTACAILAIAFGISPGSTGASASPDIRTRGLDEAIFANGFEGFGPPGPSISGRVLSDPDYDGDLADGVPVPGATVYLDLDFNGRLDDGEPVRVTGGDGLYEFTGLSFGLKHVRQTLPAPNVQTYPAGGITPALDGRPDEVVEYVHAAPGVGDFDVPYGKNASAWPAEWNERATGALPEPIASLDLVLKPLGVRNRTVGNNASNGAEVLSLPQGAILTLRFDEAIIDGPGPDFQIYSLPSGASNEQVEIRVGPDPGALTSLGLFEENLGTVLIDLAPANLLTPVHYVQLIAQDNGGTWKGFEVIALEALNIASPDPGAHVVVVTQDEQVFTDRDFGRHFRDLPPTLTIGVSDGVPATPGLRSGESVGLQLNASDDLALASVQLSANGQAIALDAANQGTLALSNPGELVLRARATDSSGQVTERDATYYVLNADGSDPLNPNQIGQGAADAAGAPRVRILSPVAGDSLAGDVEVIATVSDAEGITSWALEYAPVDEIDPFGLAQPDADYLPLASGSGEVFSSPIGTVPLSTLPDGIYFLRLSARDAGGRNAYAGQVLARNVDGPALRPSITIESPSGDSLVTLTIDILGSIVSSRPLVEWFVEYARASEVDLKDLGSDAPNWTRIASGDQPLAPGSVFANFDSTLLRNDSYVIRVVARNDIGLGWAEPLLLNVSGNAKLGRNRLEFADIEIELAGFPLRLVRVYDSLQANEDGELGFGWSLGLRSTDVGETVPDTGLFGLFGSTPFRVGTRVYLNAPSGERLGFTFVPEAGTSGPLGTPYRVGFTPDPGNYHRLEVPQGDLAFLDLRSDGTVALFGFDLPYNPETYVLVAQNGKRYTIHEDTGLLRAEDPNGNTLTFNPAGIQHSAGPRLSFSRDAQGRITTVTDPDGNAWQYAYDAQGDLVTFTDPDGNITRYEYLDTQAHYLERILDPQGRIPRRYEYDPDNGRLIAVIDEQGNRRETMIDPQGFAGASMDARGNLTEFEYDARGNVTRIVDPKGHVFEYEYADGANPDRETRFTDADGEDWVYQYDAGGRPTRLTTPLTVSGNQRVEVTYDARGNITRYEDVDNRVDTFTYDALGNRISEDYATAVGASYEYGPAGQLLRRELSAEFAIDFSYDANGLPASRSDSHGFLQQTEYLPNGRLIRRSDDNGELDVAFTPGGRLEMQFDDAGNEVSLVENADGSLSRTDRTSDTTRIHYDADKRPVQVDLPGGGSVETTFDADGNPASITDPLGNSTGFGFDSTNQLVSITDAVGRAERFTRDRHGNVTEIIDRNGKRRAFEWDANRRIRAERWFDGVDVVREIIYTYNGIRGLERVDDTWGGQTYSISYAGTLPRVTAVNYDLPGQQPWKVRYAWSDEASTPLDIRATVGATSTVNLARIFVEAIGDRSLRLEWQHPQSTGRDNEVRLYRRPDGRIARVVRLTGANGGDAQSQTVLGYDGLGQIVAIDHLDAAGNPLHPNAMLDYQRDAEYRVLGETHAGNASSHVYDADGQLLSTVHSNAAYADESYTYDGAGNRLTSHLAPAPATVIVPNRIVASGDLDLEYDDAGNLVRRTDTGSGVVTEFGYDHRNRLVLATLHPSLGAPPSSTFEFGYDYLDRLLYRTVDGARTWVLHDRDQPFAEFADGASVLSAAYLYDPAGTDNHYAVWRDDALGERWFLLDTLGSVRGITNAAFAVQSWVDYDSYGNLQPGAMPAAGEPIAFAGRTFLAGLGLYDSRRRFYAPQLGRFTQEDPLRFAGGDFNLYRYAFNSPANFVDPRGESNIAEVYFVLVAETLISGGTSGDELSIPCIIARWTAAKFSLFVPLADLIANPQSAGNNPTLEPAPLFELTGCPAS